MLEEIKKIITNSFMILTFYKGIIPYLGNKYFSADDQSPFHGLPRIEEITHLIVVDNTLMPLIHIDGEQWPLYDLKDELLEPMGSIAALAKRISGLIGTLGIRNGLKLRCIFSDKQEMEVDIEDIKDNIREENILSKILQEHPDLTEIHPICQTLLHNNRVKDNLTELEQQLVVVAEYAGFMRNTTLQTLNLSGYHDMRTTQTGKLAQSKVSIMLGDSALRISKEIWKARCKMNADIVNGTYDIHGMAEKAGITDDTPNLSTDEKMKYKKIFAGTVTTHSQHRKTIRAKKKRISNETCAQAENTDKKRSRKDYDTSTTESDKQEGSALPKEYTNDVKEIGKEHRRNMHSRKKKARVENVGNTSVIPPTSMLRTIRTLRSKTETDPELKTCASGNRYESAIGPPDNNLFVSSSLQDQRNNKRPRTTTTNSKIKTKDETDIEDGGPGESPIFEDTGRTQDKTPRKKVAASAISSGHDPG